jgi:hypothetical protein
MAEVWTRFLTMNEEQVVDFLRPIGGPSATWHHNLDGFVVHGQRGDVSTQCYTQLFRDGGIEVLSGGVLVKDEQRGGFYAGGMEGTVIPRFGRYQAFWQAIGVIPPLLIGLTLSGVRGWKVLRGSCAFSDVEGAFDRDVVVLPEVIISDLSTPADLVLRPLFDFVWNGGGWPRSPNYRDGRWLAPQ